MKKRKLKYASLLENKESFRMNLGTKTFKKLYTQSPNEVKRDISNSRKAKFKSTKNVGRVEKVKKKVLEEATLLLSSRKSKEKK